MTPWAAAIASRTGARPSAPRAQIDTDAPASARPSAIARPMPRLPPVTTARFPDRSIFIPQALPIPRSGDHGEDFCAPPAPQPGPGPEPGQEPGTAGPARLFRGGDELLPWDKAAGGSFTDSLAAFRPRWSKIGSDGI